MDQHGEPRGPLDHGSDRRALQPDDEVSLQVFREWSTPERLTIHQFVIRVGDWGGYMVFETTNLADIHFLSTALAGFTFQLEPVIDVMDAVVELQAMEWRGKLA
jgi:hypothetical protein